MEPNGRQRYEWDLFISYANEDKDQFVRPLAKKLKAIGLNVWYDEFTLRLGDKIRQSIDEGLLKSQYFVAVLSNHFFEKNWPQGELEGILARNEANARRLVLPVLHGLSVDEVREKSLTLAGLHSVSSEEGLDTVVEKIVEAIRFENSNLRIKYNLSPDDASDAQLTMLETTPPHIPNLDNVPIKSEAYVLSNLIGHGSEAGFATVDLGDGKNWLTSRLFIFSIMLRRMRNLKQFVFLGRQSNMSGTFLGTTASDKVRWAMAMKFPWLEGAFSQAYSKLISTEYHHGIKICSSGGALELNDANQLLMYFLGEIQSNDLPEKDKHQWVNLRDQRLWEHSQWIDFQGLKEIFGDDLEAFKIVDAPGKSPRQRILEVIESNVQFIAIVDENNRFSSLVDKKALLETHVKS